MENKKAVEELIDGVILQMGRMNYSKTTISTYRPHWNTLLDFVEENGFEDFTLEIIESLSRVFCTKNTV